jgi:hypothetical protein
MLFYSPLLATSYAMPNLDNRGLLGVGRDMFKSGAELRGGPCGFYSLFSLLWFGLFFLFLSFLLIGEQEVAPFIYTT